LRTRRLLPLISQPRITVLLAKSRGTRCRNGRQSGSGHSEITSGCRRCWGGCPVRGGIARRFLRRFARHVPLTSSPDVCGCTSIGGPRTRSAGRVLVDGLSKRAACRCILSLRNSEMTFRFDSSYRKQTQSIIRDRRHLVVAGSTVIDSFSEKRGGNHYVGPVRFHICVPGDCPEPLV
jgi:hypothetical protein